MDLMRNAGCFDENLAPSLVLKLENMGYLEVRDRVIICGL